MVSQSDQPAGPLMRVPVGRIPIAPKLENYPALDSRAGNWLSLARNLPLGVDGTQAPRKEEGPGGRFHSDITIRYRISRLDLRATTANLWIIVRGRPLRTLETGRLRIPGARSLARGPWATPPHAIGQFLRCP